MWISIYLLSRGDTFVYNYDETKVFEFIGNVYDDQDKIKHTLVRQVFHKTDEGWAVSRLTDVENSNHCARVRPIKVTITTD